MKRRSRAACHLWATAGPGIEQKITHGNRALVRHKGGVAKGRLAGVPPCQWWVCVLVIWLSRVDACMGPVVRLSVQGSVFRCHSHAGLWEIEELCSLSLQFPMVLQIPCIKSNTPLAWPSPYCNQCRSTYPRNQQFLTCEIQAKVQLYLWTGETTEGIQYVRLGVGISMYCTAVSCSPSFLPTSGNGVISWNETRVICKLLAQTTNNNHYTTCQPGTRSPDNNTSDSILHILHISNARIRLSKAWYGWF